MYKKDLHERILLFLFDKRDNDGHFDLYIEFSNDNEQRVWEIAEELRQKEYIDIETIDDFFFLVETSRPIKKSVIKSEKQKLKAKIKTLGIEYVKQNLLNKTHELDKWSKIIGNGGIIFGVVIGAISLLRENKYQEEYQQVQKKQSSIDSITLMLHSIESDRENLSRTKDKEIQLLTSKVDSLLHVLKVDKKEKK